MLIPYSKYAAVHAAMSLISKETGAMMSCRQCKARGTMRRKPMRLNHVTLRLVFIPKRWRVCTSSRVWRTRPGYLSPFSPRAARQSSAPRASAHHRTGAGLGRVGQTLWGNADPDGAGERATPVTRRQEHQITAQLELWLRYLQRRRLQRERP
jgi:hypothetical protein